MKRWTYNKIVAFALLIAGLGAFIIVFSSIYTMRHNVSIVADYLDDKEKATQQVSIMAEKNKTIDKERFGIEADPFLAEVTEPVDSSIIGALVIPQINERLVLYDTTNSSTLSKGVAVLDGTHYPTGGKGNTSVITGHRGLVHLEIFRHLDKLSKGDVFYIENGKDTLYYEVYESLIVLPEDTSSIQPIKDQDTVILLTCDTPDISKGLNTHRLLLYAKRVTKPQEPAIIEKVDVKETPSTYTQAGIYTQWVYVGLGALCFIVAWIRLKNK